MAISFFEGYEKRLELHFSGDHPLGLRRIPFHRLREILLQVECAVVSAVANHHLDSYVLSESSLFVSSNTFIIKTCGSTKLLNSLPPLLSYAPNLGLSLLSCKYTRGSFLSPSSQPSPHSSFSEEISFLNSHIPSSLPFRLSSVLPSASPSQSWHLFYASAVDGGAPAEQKCTVEICMRGIDRGVAGGFYSGGEGGGEVEGRRMRERNGVGGIISSSSVVCDFGFEPCGYSMNGVDGECYSTVHVTPEDGFSYASFECVGEAASMAAVVPEVVKVFRPETMTVAITSGGGGGAWREVEKKVGGLGWECRSSAEEKLPCGGNVVFQMFDGGMKK